MKIIIPAALYFFLFFPSALAQKIHYKLKAGTNFSNVTINGDSPFKTNIGPTGGMTVGFPVNKNFICQTGLLYSHKGHRYEQFYFPTPQGPSSRLYKVSTNLHYLALPVLAGYNLKDKWQFSLGPQLTYLLSAREKTKNIQSRRLEYYHKLDFSGVAMVEYKIIKSVGIYGGYDYGLTKFIKGITAVNDTRIEYVNYGNNRTFFLGLFYEGKVLTKR
jgi:hypothetical protein